MSLTLSLGATVLFTNRDDPLMSGNHQNGGKIMLSLYQQAREVIVIDSWGPG